MMNEKRILLVDDDESYLDLIELALEEVGAKTVRASSGQEALLAITACRPDLVVSDMWMPGMHGTELKDEAQRTGRDVPFLFVSGHFEPGRTTQSPSRLVAKGDGPSAVVARVTELLAA